LTKTLTISQYDDLSAENVDVLELLVIFVVELDGILLPEIVGFVHWCPR
jgi:hypothetical protein